MKELRKGGTFASGFPAAMVLAVAVAFVVAAGGGLYWLWPHPRPPEPPPGRQIGNTQPRSGDPAARMRAAGRQALTIPGKTSLYQRVLTRPGARLRESPTTADPAGSEVPPLSILYVYGRRQVNGAEWLELGPGVKGSVEGWLPASQAIDWRQTLTVAFARMTHRQPTLFFRSRAALIALLQSQHLASESRKLRDRIREGRLPAGFPVIAEEPSTYVDPNRQFYLLPILGHEEVVLASDQEAKVLEVAAVTLTQSREQNAAPFRAGIVFVIDTTSSMGAYIDRTRAAVHRMYRRLRGSPLGGALSFGLIAFRDNTDVAPGLEYVSRVVATLDDGRDPARFFAKVDQVEAARVSSQGFDEDAFAGIYDAIERIDWRGYSGRYVVLVTDAGAREGNDSLSRTHLGATGLSLLAHEKDQTKAGMEIAIAALHLLTPEGREDHRRAAAQYGELTRWGGTDLYFPVEGGSVAAFGTQVDALADALVKQIEGIRAGRAVKVPEGPGASEVERKTAIVSRAMQLAYLGREQGSQAPRLIRAWVTDLDLSDPTQTALEVRALIDKNQLSNLQETLRAILDAGNRNRLTPTDFFAQLRSAAVALARDPDEVSPIKVRRLADVGVVGEWLDNLPYTTQLMHLTEPLWLSRTYAQQQTVLDDIGEKIRLYRSIHDTTGRWIDLSGRGSKGASVTTIPLDALP